MARNWLIIAACYLVRLAALPLTPFSTGIWRLYHAQLFPISFCRTLSLGYHRRFAKWEREFVWRRIKGNPVPLLSWARVVGAEYLTEARNSRRGILLVTFHSPFFRVFQYLVNQLDDQWRPYLLRMDLSSIAKRKSRECYQHQLQIFAGRLLLTSPQEIRRMTKLLIQGATVIISPDGKEANDSAGQFFGRKLSLTLGVVRLAEMTDALILPALVTGRFWGRPWRLNFWEPIDPHQGSTKNRLLSVMESMLANYPEIWNRWRLVLAAPEVRKEIPGND